MATIEYARRHKVLGLCRSCPRPVFSNSTVYCEYHKGKSNERSRRGSKRDILKFKTACLECYGKSCQCCGETIIQFLTIDHEGGKGNDHRKSLFKYNVGGLKMYRWLKKNNYPSGYRILCMNCNWGTRYNTICPHKSGGVG